MPKKVIIIGSACGNCCRIPNSVKGYQLDVLKPIRIQVESTEIQIGDYRFDAGPSLLRFGPSRAIQISWKNPRSL
jgi:hypothetical protein